jgi:hypothetical protein
LRGGAVGRVDRGEIPAVGGIAVLRQRDVDIGGEISAARLKVVGAEDKAAGGAVIGGARVEQIVVERRAERENRL